MSEALFGFIGVLTGGAITLVATVYTSRREDERREKQHEREDERQRNQLREQRISLRKTLLAELRSIRATAALINRLLEQSYSSNGVSIPIDIPDDMHASLSHRIGMLGDEEASKVVQAYRQFRWARDLVSPVGKEKEGEAILSHLSPGGTAKVKLVQHGVILIVDQAIDALEKAQKRES